MVRKKLIGYDLDGTLVDTRRDIINGVKFMLKEMGKPERTDVEIENAVGEGLHHLVAATLGENDKKIVERGAKTLRRYYEEHLLENTRLYPDADKVLERFKDRVQVVITNKPEPFTTRILTGLKVMPYLKGVFTGCGDKQNGLLPRKPDPAALLHVLKENGIKASEALWIGDSLIDFETGKNAGVETVLVRHGFASRTNLESLGADHLLNNFTEFLKLAEEKNW